MPKIVTTGVSAATSSRRLGSSFARVGAMARRAERRELRGLPADGPGRGEELDVLGVRARPAALDVGHPELVEHARDPQLVGERERHVLALRPVAQGRVVEDDRGVVARSCRHPRFELVDDGRRRTPSCRRPRRPSSRVARDPRGPRPPAVVERPADGRLDGRGGVFAPERQPEQHRRRQDRADRIGLVLPGDVRRRPVDRLVQPERAVLGRAARRARPTAACPASPASTAASSDRMSPNRFSVTITSKSAGRRTSSIAHESTSWCWSVDVRVVAGAPRRRPSATAARWRGRSPCRPDVTRPRRPRASSNASRTMREISRSWYGMRVEGGRGRRPRPTAPRAPRSTRRRSARGR